MIQIKNNTSQIEWDNFIDQTNNGTIFHKQKFLQYHDKDKFKFTFLSFFKGNELVAVLPGSIKNKVFKSPTGASYGSFATIDLNFATYEEIIDAFLNYCQKKSTKEIYLTPPPLIYSNRFNEIERFLLRYKGFSEEVHLISNAVKISDFKSETDLLKSFTSMHYRAVKKSINLDVSVKISDDYEEFYKILLENKKKFKTTPTHTLEELLKLNSLLSESLKLFMAFNKEHQPIAGILVFVVNNTTLLAFYISHYFEFQELRAVNRLFFEVMKWGIENNYQWFDLGVSMDTFSNNPMEPSRSLIFFKEGIGSKGFLRTTYHKKLTNE